MTEPSRSHHGRAKEIFAAASELPIEQRRAFVADRTRDDPALREHVLRLLAALDGPEPFLREPTALGGAAPALHAESPTADSASRPPSDRPPTTALIAEGPGSIIGPYRLLQLIGEGGFGRVFMAEQERPVRRRVALKIIKLGMDTRQVVARFEQERQALAVMDHPHIAKVFDAGATEAGRPYFVMELCDGEAVTAYCDRHNLSVPERLELFQQVCQAVQHAHQKGVIHRDIKPSNVLVSTHDGRPFAKVIDFGIAKATQARLTERTLFTEHRQLIGTPEYMSPEQAEGSVDIDTRTDVYSLGVLLYELVAGSTPFSAAELRSAAFGEIQRIIREVDPPSPSTRLSQNTATLEQVAARRRLQPRQLGSLVRGELDWIVMKAMDKDRSRRYQSPAGLASDIDCYLTGRPIVAAPPGAGYLARKFVRRHLGKVVAAGLVGAALLIGAVGTTVGFINASRERDQSRIAQADAEAVTEYLTKVLSSADPGSMGRDVTVRQVIDEASRKIDPKIRARPGVEARVREAIGRTYLALGEYEAATANIQQAHELGRGSLGADSEHTLRMAELVGRAAFFTGKYEGAESHLKSVLDRASAAFGADSAPALNARNSLAMLQAQTGRPAEAEAGFRSAAEGYARLEGPDSENTLGALGSLAVALSDQGKFEEADRVFADADARLTRVLGSDHPTTLSNRNNHAWSLQARGEAARAAEIGLQAFEGRKRVLGPDHPDTLQSESNLALSYRSLNRIDESLALTQRVLDANRRQLGSEHPETLISIANLAKFYMEAKAFEQALPLFEEGEAGYRKVLGATHPYAAQTILGHGICLRQMGRNQQAAAKLTEAHELLAGLGPTMQGAARRAAQEMATVSDALGHKEESDRWRATVERLTPPGLPPKR